MLRKCELKFSYNLLYSRIIHQILRFGKEKICFFFRLGQTVLLVLRIGCWVLRIGLAGEDLLSFFLIRSLRSAPGGGGGLNKERGDRLCLLADLLTSRGKL